MSAAAARSIRTASRRISGWVRTGFTHRLVAASPRMVSHPNAIGSRRIIRNRICCMNNPKRAGESLPLRTSVRPVSPGGKLSNASQETSTAPSDAGGAVADEQLDECPAGVVADEGDVVQVEAVDELCHQPRHPRQRQVGVGVHAATVRAERQRR